MWLCSHTALDSLGLTFGQLDRALPLLYYAAYEVHSDALVGKRAHEPMHETKMICCNHSVDTLYTCSKF